MRRALRTLAAAAAVAAVLVVPAYAQRAGDEVPPGHPARAIVARPVFTAEPMVAGTWHTVELGSGARTLSGEPVACDIQVGDGEVSITSRADSFGPRTFGIVRSRRVSSWVEYELRGQGGTYFLTAQLGTRGDGGRDAVFVLSPPPSRGAPQRYAVPGAAPALPSAEIAERAAGHPAGRSGDLDAEPRAEPSGRPRRVTGGSPAPGDEGIARVETPALLAAAVRRVSPVYPPVARSANVEGTVIVRVSVDVSGSVTSAKAVSGPATLRGEAERAARGWRFRPFVDAGSARPVTGEIPFRFSL